MGACTFLNQMGDTTIAWSEDQDDEWEKIIEAKMKAGVSFFIIDPRVGTRTKLKRADDAMRHRHLAIPDADVSAFVGVGIGEVIPTPAKAAKARGRAKTAKEAAKAETVAVQPRRGG